MRWMCVGLLMVGCAGGDPTPSSQPSTSDEPVETDLPTDTDEPTETEVVPVNGPDLRAWISDGAYLEWAAESGVHGSAGPHFGSVRTFVNPSLEASLADTGPHPIGAAAVKELYGDGNQIRGYAVLVKVSLGMGADSFYWYEDFDGTVFSDDVGDPQCTGCHSGGRNFVLTPYPLQ